MKANSTHISLETAKLLKDCGVDSEYYYYQNELIHNELFYKIYDEHKGMGIYGIECQNKMMSKCYPVYTWQEILWEYPVLFFGEKGVRSATGLTQIPVKYYEIYPNQILHLLQQKKYDEADKYFQDHCILTK